MVVKKRKFCFVFLSVILLLLMMIVFATPVFAVQSQQSEDGVGFTVSAQLPQNQINSNVSYFDLKMAPEDKQVLDIIVKNTSTEEIEVEVEAITASTNRNGIIDYTTPGIQDESMLVAFSNIATAVENSLVIPANSSKTAQVLVTMPKDEYDGVILGGIQFKKINKDQVESEIEIDNSIISSKPQNNSTVIENRYSYIIGVKLTETDVEVLPNFEMVNVEPNLVNYQKAITNYIRNTQPYIVKGLDVSVTIFKENSTQVFLQNSLQNIDMAPNSVLPFPVELGDVTLSPGKYVSNIHLKLNEQEWDFIFPFTVTGEEIASLNKNAVKETSGIPIWAIILIIFAAIILLLLLFLIFLLLQKRKKGDEIEEK